MEEMGKKEGYKRMVHLKVSWKLKHEGKGMIKKRI